MNQTHLHNVDWSRLPAPQDDGAAQYLPGRRVPARPLLATDGARICLATLLGWAVVYAYPMMGAPHTPLPEGWDMIPGARGCTPQACAFRDHLAELKAAGAAHLFGLSTQSHAFQQSAHARLHLPYPLLCDSDGAFAAQLSMPTFEVAGQQLLKRITLIIHQGRIAHVFYPIFPPDQHPQAVIDWFTSHIKKSTA